MKVWFKNRRAKFRKKQRATKCGGGGAQRTDSPGVGSSAAHQSSTNEEGAHRRRATKCGGGGAQHTDSPGVGSSAAHQSSTNEEGAHRRRALRSRVQADASPMPGTVSIMVRFKAVAQHVHSLAPLRVVHPLDSQTQPPSLLPLCPPLFNGGPGSNRELKMLIG